MGQHFARFTVAQLDHLQIDENGLLQFKENSETMDFSPEQIRCIGCKLVRLAGSRITKTFLGAIVKDKKGAAAALEQVHANVYRDHAKLDKSSLCQHGVLVEEELASRK
jgi:hypothetical protein